MKKVWIKVRGILGGGWGIPSPLIFTGLAFATYGLFKPAGIFFGCVAVISLIVSLIWANQKKKK